MRSILFFAILLVSVVGYAKDNGYLIKFKNSAVLNNFQNQMLRSGQQVKDLKVANWVKVDLSEQEVEALRNHPDVAKRWKLFATIPMWRPLKKTKF